MRERGALRDCREGAPHTGQWWPHCTRARGPPLGEWDVCDTRIGEAGEPCAS